ncbi:hypothetical protein [Kiloniella sp.]|uniref:hypothetical protein n=1 Tax=Kiloniella sp. TaxID=1938587 RepID=UPI003A8ECF62
MLIIFDVPRLELERENLDIIENLYSELLRASINGIHLVVMTREVSNWGLENLSLNRRETAHLKLIKQIYTQNAGLIEISFCSLSIEIGEDGLTEPTPHNYRISHKELLEGNYLSESILLVENIENDGQLYKHILGEVKNSHKVKSFNFSLRNGGGSTIVSVFQHEIQNEKVVVCICDSDKYAPNDTISSTYRNLKGLSRRHKFIGLLSETIGREAENIIPLDIIKDTYLCPNYENYDQLEELLELQNTAIHNDCLWLFLDIKNGLNGEELLQRGKLPATLQWIQSKYLRDNNSEILNIDVPGFGDAVIGQFLNSWEAKSAFHSFFRSNYWTLHFKEFFEQIYWYFVSNKIQAVN